MKAQTKEFNVGLANVAPNEKFTPKAATVNGVKGRIWTKRLLRDGVWVHQGQQFLRSAAIDVEIMAAFDRQEIDHDAVDSYWNSVA